MIKKFQNLLPIILLIIIGCAFTKREIPIYIDENKYGWYYLFIEVDSKQPSLSSNESILMCDSNVFFIKVRNPKDVKFQVFQCNNNDIKITDRMKLVTISNGKSISCFKFYYPFPSIRFKEVGINKVKDSIESAGYKEFDSLVEKYDVDWYTTQNIMEK